MLGLLVWSRAVHAEGCLNNVSSDVILERSLKFKILVFSSKIHFHLTKNTPFWGCGENWGISKLPVIDVKINFSIHCINKLTIIAFTCSLESKIGLWPSPFITAFWHWWRIPVQMGSI